MQGYEKILNKPGNRRARDDRTNGDKEYQPAIHGHNDSSG